MRKSEMCIEMNSSINSKPKGILIITLKQSMIVKEI